MIAGKPVQESDLAENPLAEPLPGPAGSHERTKRGMATSPADTGAVQFYGQRVAVYAKLLAKVFGGLYVAGIVLSLVLAPQMFVQMHTHPAKVMNLAQALFALLVWRLALRPNQPSWQLVVLDFALPMSVTLGASAIYPSMRGMLGFEMILILILLMVITLVFRAALVPSPPQRTTLIALLTGLPILVASYLIVASDPHAPSFVTPTVGVAGASVWVALITIATRITSQEIYGLQKEVRNARRLGQYTLLELVGEGGMGAVYRAQHAMLRRPTAVKLLLPERAGRENIVRFEREVQLTSMLTHPNTIAIYDFGRSADNIFYYAMEYLDGVSLQQLVDRYGPQPPERVLHILLQASDALAEAHEIGLIHRDIKPANILLCERGGAPDVVKVVDFGLVKDLNPNKDPTLTQAGALTGTPLYLAPETILHPDKIDHLVDIYALGAVAYFLLTGMPVFEGSSVIEVCGHHLHTQPIPPSARVDKPIPSDLEAIVLRCLAKSPADRPANAQALHDALVACAGAGKWTPRQARTWWKEHRASDTKPSAATPRKLENDRTQSFSRTLRVMR